MKRVAARRATTVILTAVLAVVGPLASSAAAAKPKPSRVDVARANAQQIRRELQSVTQRINAQQAKHEAAQQASAAAKQRLTAARAELAALEARIQRLRGAARTVALQAYMSAGHERLTVTSENPALLARANYLRTAVLGQASDALDGLRAARQDADAARRSAEAAAKVASDRSQAVDQALAALRASRSRQLQLAAAAEARLDAAVRDADAIRRIGARGSRGYSKRGAVSLTTVRGITVATSIANQLDRMLGAAEADGARFGGNGYRSSEGQIAARKRNCGTSQYAIYDMPASKCRPPTARPGQSMHEQGLAIDFTYNGSLIQSRSSDGYKWLNANASRFGFYNLPSEAWHWSTNGN